MSTKLGRGAIILGCILAQTFINRWITIPPHLWCWSLRWVVAPASLMLRSQSHCPTKFPAIHEQPHLPRLFGDHVAGRDQRRISVTCVASSNSEKRPDFGSWKPLFAVAVEDALPSGTATHHPLRRVKLASGGAIVTCFRPKKGCTWTPKPQTTGTTRVSAKKCGLSPLNAVVQRHSNHSSKQSATAQSEAFEWGYFSSLLCSNMWISIPIYADER